MSIYIYISYIHWDPKQRLVGSQFNKPSLVFNMCIFYVLFNLVNQHYSKGVGNYIVYNKEYVYACILFTNDQTKWNSTSLGCFSRSTAFIVDSTWKVNCTQLCNNYRPIITRDRNDAMWLDVYNWVYNKPIYFI